MVKRLPSEAQFLVVTFLLVLLLGARTLTSLVEEDYAQEGVIAASSREASRAPASIQNSIAQVQPANALKSSLSSLLSVDLSCGKKAAPTDFKITGQFVQFKGKNCLKGFKQEKIEIVNNSNGSTASIFPYGHNLYQTDLIQLKAGTNEISIRHESGGVKFEQIVKVSAHSI